MQPRSAGIILCAVGLFPIVSSVRGQTPLSAPPPNAFASEPYVIRSSSTVTTMNADGTGTRLQTFAVSVQSESALHSLSVLSIIFSSQSEHADFVYARVVHPDGSVQETPVADAIEQPAPVTQQAPLYSDLETKQLPVKSLRVGDQLEWQARFTGYHPEVPGQFWGQSTFASGVVILDESYELRVPAGFHLTVWTNPRAGATTSDADEAGQHIYRWKHSDLHPTVGADAEAAKKAEDRRLLTPDEELDATEGKLPSFAWTTFPDWAAVGAWYRALVADRIAPDAAIKAKVDELTSGKSTDLEKAQAIYNFVSARIRYVGVDFGIGRYQPHTAAEVFANQYGDCKDKHVLLASMLSVLNLHADPVLVGAGIRFNSSVPSPASFNHLITRLSLNGKDVWLDSTAEVGTWGALLKPIRDQDALVVPAAPPAVVVHTPVDLPFPQTATTTLDGSLDKDLTSDSKFTLVLHDDDELVLRSVLRTVSPSDYGTFVQLMMSGMGFGGTTSEPEIDHIEDPSHPLQIAFHYHRVKEKDWGENRITAAFQPISLPNFTADQPPTSTIQLGSQRSETSTVTLQLPEGWNAELPAPVHAHQPFATCDVTYTFFQNHLLSAERRLVVLQSKVPIKNFKLYQSWYDECGAGGVPYIQLFPTPKVTASATLPEPKAPEAHAGTQGNAAPSDPKAADLIQQATQSLRSMDLDSARKHLDEAAAINPTEPNLWTSYAEIARLLGASQQVFDDIQRELSYHPDEVRLYPLAASYLATQRDTKGEFATLHSWVKAAPDSAEAAIKLTDLLLDLKQPADAAREAQQALDRISSASDADRMSLRITAAKANVQLGYTSIAANSVAPLLKTATDPAQVNDIAAILAEGSAHLTEAADAEARVIDADEAESASWTAETKLPQIQHQQSRLFSEWDTMALILFHQGKFSQAYGYSMAALHNNNTKDVRDHLASINSVLHNPVAAAVLRSPDQALRTLPLGPANGHQGVVFVTLVLADGKVIDSRTEESSSPGPKLSDPAPILSKADLKAFFPSGSKAHLIRTGFVNCHSGICELVLSPFDGLQVIQVSGPPGSNAIRVTHLPQSH
jgi:transglutaminase-like putative cysteine protease/tetratricopeptide (TPR) repeat protein